MSFGTSLSPTAQEIGGHGSDALCITPLTAPMQNHAGPELLLLEEALWVSQATTSSTRKKECFGQSGFCSRNVFISLTWHRLVLTTWYFNCFMVSYSCSIRLLGVCKRFWLYNTVPLAGGKFKAKKGRNAGFWWTVTLGPHATWGSSARLAYYPPKLNNLK